MIEAIMRIVIKGSQIRYSIVAVKNFHCMDKNSDDVARDLLRSAPGWSFV